MGNFWESVVAQVGNFESVAVQVGKFEPLGRNLHKD